MPPGCTLERFQRIVRARLGMAPGHAFDMKFNVDLGGGERVALSGVASFDAAVFVASLTAARRAAAGNAWARRQKRWAAVARRVLGALLFGVPPGSGTSVVAAPLTGAGGANACTPEARARRVGGHRRAGLGA